ncbi:hypothetical protein [Brachyspira sp.]|uniref:hypothetical protein n=1 Tax=Brachyspira sp. TaxID=1977261 RepID=UPI003D7D6008
MRNLIYLFLIVVIAIVMSACSNNLGAKNLNQTGLLDKSGNLITNTLIRTNVAYFRGTIPIWATNGKYDYVITTNVISGSDKDSIEIEIKYTDNVIFPDVPEDASDYYSIIVPYAGKTYYTVSYKDTNRLKQLWLDQIQRKGQSDGKVFAIRNRDNNRDINNFQNLKEDSKGASRYDYYYFKDNGDIVYKGGDKNVWTNEHVMKKLVGAVIVDYRKCVERTDWHNNNYAADKIENTGEWTVGAIYKMATPVNEARELFKNGGEIEGAYDFIATRKWIWYFNNDFYQDKVYYVRQFYNTNFMEVLVLNRNRDWDDMSGCLGVDAYYAYYGSYRSQEGDLNPSGFTHENYPYMTDENLYLAHRPEDIVPLLTHTTTFADAMRGWRFMAMPGHKY